MTRWFPVSGEIHLARVPASQWREQLLRMKAGGLDMIAVYVFWIHHEERRGTFTFDGRRNVTQFLAIAQEVGLHVLMRVGPWDHGEAGLLRLRTAAVVLLYLGFCFARTASLHLPRFAP